MLRAILEACLFPFLEYGTELLHGWHGYGDSIQARSTLKDRPSGARPHERTKSGLYVSKSGRQH